MSKGKKHQKKQPWKQLKLFSISGAPVEGSFGVTGKPTSMGDELQSRLKAQRVGSVNILKKIVAYENLDRAYKQVVSNQGIGGVDGMSVDELRGYLKGHLEPLRSSLVEGTYQVSPVLKVEIPKGSGGKRVLGIPTVKDRLVQQAIHQQLTYLYDPHFSDHSYGFRPGRSGHQAIEQASRYVKEGKQWVVDLDLENFFDGINHDRLMQRLSKGIGDKGLLVLIRSFLKAGMMEGGLTTQRVSGTPQGGPLSPLLSNIILDELDKELESRGHSFCRYADDCNIYVRSRKAGERVMESMVKFIEKKLKLKVNRTKSGVRHCGEVNFLGYTLLGDGEKRVSDKSVTRLKDKIRQITRRNRGVRFEQVIGELNKVILGWSNYFGLASRWLSTFRNIDSWIRRKVRCYRLKQCGRKYTIFKLLRGLGVATGKSWNAIKYSQGWWQMSKTVAANQAMNLQWFAHQGLQSLYYRMQAKS